MIFKAPVLLVGNGHVDTGAWELVWPFYQHVVAADGGANAALAHGLVLDATIGDMDSSAEDKTSETYGEIVHISEQSSIDFEKCLTVVDAPFFIGVGFLGGRLDHELAALNTLVKTGKNVVLIGEIDLIFLLPDLAKLSLPVGTRVSTFPMGVVEGVKSEGLAWPLDGLEMSPSAFISTSNHTAAPEVTFRNPAQPLLCILPRNHLQAVLKLFKS